MWGFNAIQRGVAAMFAVAVVLLSGCASVTSVSKPSEARHARGLIYRLPVQWVQIKLVVDANGKRTVTIDPTEPFGDPTAIYVARHQSNLIANNKSTLVVDRNGLLQTNQVSTVESQIGAGLVALAQSAGLRNSAPGENVPLLATNASRDGDNVPPANDCAVEGTFFWYLDPSAPKSDATKASLGNCHLVAEIETLYPEISIPDATEAQSPAKDNERLPGFYFRQTLPFQVIITDSAVDQRLKEYRRVLLLPSSKSPLGFVPISRTLFAKNTTTINFKDGMPTSVDVNQESEWLAVAKIPADVINAYVKALTDGFKNNSAALDERSKYLAAFSKFSAQEAKTAACQAELRKEKPDPAQVSALCQ